LGAPKGAGLTSNGQRHGLRDGFQRPWKGDRQLRSMVRCEEPTAMRFLMDDFRVDTGLLRSGAPGTAPPRS
jgi:hypothetical protein